LEARAACRGWFVGLVKNRTKTNKRRLPSAVFDLPKPKLHFGGFIAWFIWMSLHLFLILGVKNRFFVFCNWVYNYFTYDQSLRLIFPEFYKTTEKNLTPSSK
jgi:hypothetical protein